ERFDIIPRGLAKTRQHRASAQYYHASRPHREYLGRDINAAARDALKHAQTKLGRIVSRHFTEFNHPALVTTILSRNRQMNNLARHLARLTDRRWYDVLP